MRLKLDIYPQERIHKRVEQITPRGGSMAYTAEYVLNAAFNLADGVVTLDEFLHAVRMGPTEKRAPKTRKPKPVRAPRKPREPVKVPDPQSNPWD